MGKKGICRTVGRGLARAGERIPFKGACVLLAAYVGGGAVFAQTVRDVTARQRWPWNNLVDIDYTIEGVTDADGLSIRFTIKDGEAGVTREAAAFDRDPPLTDGVHRVTWNPAADNIRLQTTNPVCRAVLNRDDPERYLVIDLSGEQEAARYPVHYLPAPPAGGWTDEYKTTKLVMRKIDPGTFRMGSPFGETGRYDSEDRHFVTLTEPFYIGVFEVTQRQYKLVTGRNQSYYYNEKCRPVEWVSYSDIRGSDSGTNWPASSAVDPMSFLGRIRKRTGLAWLDLPTEAQWEYACRAGTETALNSGKDLANVQSDVEMDKIGRYAGNRADGKGGAAKEHTAVGSYLPNAWGLYDMHGNVWEWCLDRYVRNLGTAQATDPRGGGGNIRLWNLRGGCWNSHAKDCRSAARPFPKNTTDLHSTVIGFRLSGTPGCSREEAGAE